LGLSYLRTEMEGDPDHRAGVDFSFNWKNWFTLQGLSSYSLESADWREQNYSLALRYKGAVLEPAYHMFNYQDYFGAGQEENNLFHFLKDSQEQITILGAELQWQGSSPVRFGARYNRYSYEVRLEEAIYYAVLLCLERSDGSSIGTEMGRMDGETAENIYSLYRAYFYWNNLLGASWSGFLSGDGIHQVYDLPVYGKDSAMTYSLSAGLRFFSNRLELKLTGLYSQDPYFEDNLEGILTLQYQH
jgi:hypothetical protein